MQSTSTKNIVKIDIKMPRMYKVILLNDDETTFDFVMFVLEEIFLKSEKEARLLTMLAHEKGNTVVGTYPHDIARSRIDTVEVLKKDVGFPLTFKILPE